jgi:hypothetical protein
MFGVGGQMAQWYSGPSVLTALGLGAMTYTGLLA